jgi:predicted amidohydrolase YtcJ
VKNLIDGVLTVFTAWMLEPYTNNASTSGFPAVPEESVREKMLEAIKLGLNVRIHTIGDQAVRYVLDVFEEAEALYGKQPLRHNMEHLEYADPADIPRFQKLGIIANMHFRHAVFYIDEAKKYLGDRESHCFSWRTFYDSGAKMATGSDCPVVPFNPMLGIFSGLTRTLDNGYPEGGWLPEQKMKLHEILKIYTAGGAYALNRNGDLGTLEPGKLADITVLDKNLFSITPAEILNVKPVLTMVDGKIVFENND